jgi:beta-xylosidase
MVCSRVKPGAGSAYETWVKMGRPHNLSATELDLLAAHSQPEMSVELLSPANGTLDVSFELAPNEVLYLELREAGPVAVPKGPDAKDLQRWDIGMGEKSK